MAVCRKGICKLVRFIAQLASLSTEHHFCFKEQLTDKLWLLRLGFLADIFSKKNFMENNYQYFFSNDKIQAFKWKQEFWKTCLLPWAWQIPILKDFDEISSDINVLFSPVFLRDNWHSSHTKKLILYPFFLPLTKNSLSLELKEETTEIINSNWDKRNFTWDPPGKQFGGLTRDTDFL